MDTEPKVIRPREALVERREGNEMDINIKECSYLFSEMRISRDISKQRKHTAGLGKQDIHEEWGSLSQRQLDGHCGEQKSLGSLKSSPSGRWDRADDPEKHSQLAFSLRDQQTLCLSLLVVKPIGLTLRRDGLSVLMHSYPVSQVMLSSSCPHPNKMPFGYCYSNELKSQKERVQSKGSKPAFLFQRSQLFSPRVMEFPSGSQLQLERWLQPKIPGQMCQVWNPQRKVCITFGSLDFMAMTHREAYN